MPSSTTESTLAIVMTAGEEFPSNAGLAQAIKARIPNIVIPSEILADPKGTLVFLYEEYMFAVGKVDAQCPISKDDPCVQFAWYWADAWKAVSKHKAHLLESVSGGADAKRRTTLHGQLVAAVVDAAKDALAVHWTSSDSLWPGPLVAQTIAPGDQKPPVPVPSFRGARSATSRWAAMLLPLMWLRKKKLERLLGDYPLYDPPHKVEERVLPKEKAQENFEYLMRVRKERVAFFSRWLNDEFGVAIEPTPGGVEALNRWMVRYGGLLLPNLTVENSYFTYDPPWRGEGAGCNVLFDVGITFGEFLITNCPNLRWDMDPISALRPNEARILKREFGSSFWRPILTGFENPHWGVNPLHDTCMYAIQLEDITTFGGMKKLNASYTPGSWSNLYYSLVTTFLRIIGEYKAGDPTVLYGSTGMPTDLEGDDDE